MTQKRKFKRISFRKKKELRKLKGDFSSLQESDAVKTTKAQKVMTGTDPDDFHSDVPLDLTTKRSDEK